MPAAARRAAGTMGGDRPVTIGGSIALIVIGAILRFGITWKPAHVDLHAIGVILMIAGVAGLILSVAFLATRRRGRASAQVYEERRTPNRLPDKTRRIRPTYASTTGVG
jgi:hypothetical protein